MDILHLVDRLEELFNESRAIPLTHQVIVDEDRMLDIIDQMRVSIPEEVKKAQQLLSQRDRILAQAQEEANRTLSLARDRQDQLLDRDSLVQAGETRVQAIMRQAEADAEATRQEADDYVLETLTRFEVEVERLLRQVRNGILALGNEHEEEPLTAELPESSRVREGTGV
ncbi:MAG TPA: hypothetical protein VJ768_05715 [Anaerolineales bacterium]|jgi:hypothetical protein|nr:hypothetical protein [Anaerolineales bacterium]